MATVACPGCGLPRAEGAVGAIPCPVCDVTPGTGGLRPPLAKKKHDSDPTAGMPADASELNAPGGGSRESGSWRLVYGGAAFLLGAAVGVCGLLALQAINRPQLKSDESDIVTKGIDAPPPAPLRPAVAPMPHEPHEPPTVAEPDPDPDFKPVQPPPAPGRVTVVELNEPDAIYAVPFPMKKGEHVVLKGKVKTLRVPGLDAGAILDASALEASVVTVTGKIDNRSTLKLFAPGGVVHVAGKIDGKSVVEINAPDGEVKFLLATTAEREGSKIDHDSTVAVTARVADFNGDITGLHTKVTVTLSRGALLKVAVVSGRALVEYKSQAGGWLLPDVVVGAVGRTAAVRKIE